MVFKVKEVYLVTGWTYLTADSKEDAIRRLEDGEGDFDADSGNQEHKDTKYETLQER